MSTPEAGNGSRPDWERFHEKHENMTEAIYENAGMLPHRYVFVLTNLCNLKCSFCFQMRDKRDDRMTTEDWLQVVAQLPEYARVTLTGGEPLVFKGFNEVFTAVARRFECNLITNGTLLSEENISFLQSFVKFRVLSVSVDNVGNTTRDVSRRQWQRTEEMMRFFVARRDSLGLTCQLDSKTVVLDENAHELFDIHRYCLEQLRCDTHSFQFLKGSPLQHADHMFPESHIHHPSVAPTYAKFDLIKRELERVREYNVREQRVGFMHPKLASLTSPRPLPAIDLLNEAKHRPENFQPCKYPWSSVHINVDGHLFPCLAVSMGNVKTMPLHDMINGAPFRRFRETIRRHGSVEACNRCGWLKPKSSAHDGATLPETEAACGAV